MDARWLTLALAGCLLVVTPNPVCGTNIWTDILSCVNGLANGTAPANQTQTAISNSTNNSSSEPIEGEFSMMKLFSIICGDKDGFVRCLDTSLKQSSDSMAQIIGSFFDPIMVTQAYDGLCANISAIEQGDRSEVLSCLSRVKMTPCQNEMADYFFYMSVVKKFAPPSEQLSRNTMETLLCSVTSQRRQCEVNLLRECSESLAEVMEEFYTQTQPSSCTGLKDEAPGSRDNKIE